VTERRPCLCGVTIVAPSDMDAWPPHILAHVRSAQHRAWAKKLDPERPAQLWVDIDGYEKRARG